MAVETFTEQAPGWLRMPAIETPHEIPQTWVPGVTRAATDETFRTLALRAGCTEPGIVAVTSTCAGDGKSTLALGLASVIAQDFPSRRVAYVETDFARPQVAERLGIARNPGLLDCLVRDGVMSRAALRPTAL